ncbi:MAG TPA: type II secretion system protein [Candidatus Tectomicrobia bacterium]|nr:type II secretion system protein [Candidatus Tectomicrobia bacterium]
MRRRVLDERGLTLAEILVAVAIIGIGLAGLAVVIPVSSFGVQEGAQLSTATFLAEQRIEQVRNAVWTASPDSDCIGLSAGDTAPAIPAGKMCTTTGSGAGTTTFGDEANVPGYPNYSRQTRVIDCMANAAQCSGIGDDALRLVTVTVWYRPLTGGGVATQNKPVTIQWLVSQK